MSGVHRPPTSPDRTSSSLAPRAPRHGQTSSRVLAPEPEALCPDERTTPSERRAARPQRALMSAPRMCASLASTKYASREQAEARLVRNLSSTRYAGERGAVNARRARRSRAPSAWPDTRRASSSGRSPNRRRNASRRVLASALVGETVSNGGCGSYSISSCRDSATSRPCTRSVNESAMSMPAETPAPLTWFPARRRDRQPLDAHCPQVVAEAPMGGSGLAIEQAGGRVEPRAGAD